MEVMEAVPAEKLLIYDIRDGWEPLCRFPGGAGAGDAVPASQRQRTAFWTRFREGRPLRPSWRRRLFRRGPATGR